MVRTVVGPEERVLPTPLARRDRDRLATALVDELRKPSLSVGLAGLILDVLGVDRVGRGTHGSIPPRWKHVGHSSNPNRSAWGRE